MFPTGSARPIAAAAIVAFAATAWVTAIIAWRLIKGPKR